METKVRNRPEGQITSPLTRQGVKMTQQNDNNNFLTCPLAKVGGGNNGSSKSAVPEDIYEAICIGVVDAGKSETTWQGKTKLQQNAVIVWQIDYINGFGSQTVITDWVKPSTHENSRWTKEFVTPTKLKLNSMGDLVGKAVRVEVGVNEQGYPTILRYFASKKPIDVAEGMYIPEWIYKKEYKFVKHAKVLEGVRPKTEKVETTPAQNTKATPKTATKAPAKVVEDEYKELPF